MLSTIRRRQRLYCVSQSKALGVRALWGSGPMIATRFAWEVRVLLMRALTRGSTTPLLSKRTILLTRTDRIYYCERVLGRLVRCEKRSASSVCDGHDSMVMVGMRDKDSRKAGIACRTPPSHVLMSWGYWGPVLLLNVFQARNVSPAYWRY
jgi:hypothetical protein